MSNFAKIVIIILIIMSFFFVKEKYGANIDKFISSIGDVPKVDVKLPSREEGEKVKEPVEVSSDKVEKAEVNVYFLALDADAINIYPARGILTAGSTIQLHIFLNGSKNN